MKNRFRRCMAIILAATMTVSSVPSNVIYASEETETISEVSDVIETETVATVEETSAAETEAKETSAPETEVKETSAPETETKETSAPETEPKATEVVEEATEAAETEVKEEETKSSETSVPDSEASTEETTAPETEVVEETKQEETVVETEAPETKAPETTKETEAKVENGILLISVSTQGGKVRVKDSKNNTLKEISYVEGAEPYKLTEEVDTKIVIEVEANDGYDVGTYRLTIDSGATKDETVSNEGTKSLKKEVAVAKGTQKITVSFVELPEETETEEATEAVEIAETEETTEAVEIAETEETTEAVEIAETEEATEAVETAETEEATEAVETAETEEATEAVETAEIEEATEAVETEEVIEVVDTEESTEVTDSDKVEEVELDEASDDTVKAVISSTYTFSVVGSGYVEIYEGVISDSTLVKIINSGESKEYKSDGYSDLYYKMVAEDGYLTSGITSDGTSIGIIALQESEGMLYGLDNTFEFKSTEELGSTPMLAGDGVQYTLLSPNSHITSGADILNPKVGDIFGCSSRFVSSLVRNAYYNNADHSDAWSPNNGGSVTLTGAIKSVVGSEYFWLGHCGSGSQLCPAYGDTGTFYMKVTKIVSGNVYGFAWFANSNTSSQWPWSRQGRLLYTLPGSLRIIKSIDDSAADATSSLYTRTYGDLDVLTKVNGAKEPLSGAQFTVKYYTANQGDDSATPKKTWVFETKDDGTLDLENPVKGTVYKNSSGTPIFPIGRYELVETKAPSSEYEVDDTVYTVSLKEGSEDANGQVNVKLVKSVKKFYVYNDTSYTLQIIKKFADSSYLENSNYSLADITFEISLTEDFKKVIGTLKTSYVYGEDTYGYTDIFVIPSDYIPDGASSLTVYVREKKTNGTVTLNTDDDGNPTVKSVILKPKKLGKVTFTNEVKKSRIRVQKVSENPTLVSGNSNYSLAGAEIGIYSKATCTKSSLVDTIVTKKNGYTGWLEVDAGIYYAKEIKASPGYLLNTTVVTIDATDFGDHTFELEEPIGEVSITLKKSAASTTTRSLKGAEYTVYYEDPTCTKSASKVGKLVISSDDGQEANTLTGLLLGDYYAIETKAPEGFQKSDEILYLDCSEYKKSTFVFKGVDTETRDIKVKKVSADPTVTDGNSKYSNKGTTFSIYTDKACSDENIVTDEKGNALVLTVGDNDETNTVTLALGTYWIKETKAGKGYVLNTKPKKVTLTVNSDDPTEVEFKNHPEESSIKIKKVSSDTSATDGNSNYSHEGATFSIYTDSACSDDSIVTDDDGDALVLKVKANNESNVVDLPYGTYWIKETSAGPGYEVSTTIKKVTLTENSDKPTEVEFENKPVKKKVKVNKVSSNTSITDGNNMYSLTGATFNIYTSSACSDSDIVTDDDGSAVVLTVKSSGVTNTVTLPLGTYWIKEATAGKGYKLNTTAKKVTLKEDSDDVTTVEISNEPDVGSASAIIKKSTDYPTTKSLAGAQFTIKYYDATSATGTPKRTWVFETDANGKVNFTNRYKVSGDDLYEGTTKGEIVIPLGYVTIEETKAPSGYIKKDGILNGNGKGQAIIQATSEAGTTTVLNELEIPNTPEFGTVSIKKYDKETKEAKPQGDADLSGIEFEIVNNNDYKVSLSTDKTKSYAKGEVVYTLVTDEKGEATTGQIIQTGSYIIRESKSNSSYNNDGFEDPFKLEGDGSKKEYFLYSDGVHDTVKKGGIKIQKVDKTTNKAVPQGDADLSGAVYTITNKSKNAVKVDGKTYQPDEVVMTLTTNAKGYAETGAEVLPIGTYEVKEVTPPKGYLLNDYVATVHIETEGQYDYADTTGASTSTDATKNKWPDQVILGGIKIQKVDKDTGKAVPQGDADLSGAQFTITNVSDKAVVVNGMSYAKDKVVMTLTTNESGYAETGAKVLPYGTYEIREVTEPNGYLITTYIDTIEIRTEGQYDYAKTTKATTAADKWEDQVIRGGVKLSKYDIEVNAYAGKQGNQALEGAKFTITNRSTGSVLVNGKLYAPGEVVMTLTTDANGEASTSASALPYGTYELTEIEPPYGCLLTGENITQTFTIREEGKIVTAKDIKEDAVRGGIKVAKWDSELDREKTPQGAATLAGAEFTLTNKSNYAVYVDTDGDGVRELYQVGDTIAVLVTDKDGQIETAVDYLPVG